MYVAVITTNYGGNENNLQLIFFWSKILLSLSVNDKIVQQYNHTHKGVNINVNPEKQQTGNKTHMLKKQLIEKS